MSPQTFIQPPFHYHVESTAVARGGRAWSVFQERPHGGRMVIASGTVYPQPGESWNHDELVSLIQSSESFRTSVN